MLQSHQRFTLLYILFIVYQLNISDGTKRLKILELKGEDLHNILPLYLDQISNRRYIIVIYNSTAQNISETEYELNANRNFRRAVMGLYSSRSKLLFEQRKRREEKKTQEIKGIWTNQHQDRLDFVYKTLKNRYKPTLYLYNEMKRIQRDRQVLDPLRRMVLHLERPGNEEMKRAVMNCYTKAKQISALIDNWELYDTNNLVRNIVRDPFNDNLN